MSPAVEFPQPPPDPAPPERPRRAGGPGLGAGRPGLRTIALRVWRRACPRCGAGTLFASTFRLAPACARCALVYRREPGAMTGQMYLSAAVTELFAAALVLLVWFTTDWSTATALCVSIPLVVGFSYWFLPKAMALWVGIEFLTDVGNREVAGGVERRD